MAFTLTAQIKLQNPDNIGQFINQLRGQIGKVNVNVNVSGGSQLNTLNKQLNNVASNAKSASGSISNFGEQAALAAKRFFAFSVATNGFLKLIGAIQRGANDAIAFEKEVYKIAQVTGTAVRDLRDLTDEVTRLSGSLGVSSSKILNAAQVLAQAGLSAEDTKVALAALAKTELSATFDDISNTTEGAIAIFAQFGVKAGQLEAKLGSINAVAGKFAVESSDLVTAVRRTGGAFQAAGGSLEELISLFTSVRATTRESAESIATGFRTIFTRLQRTKTVTFLEDIGVQLRDFEGQFVGPYEAIRRLSAVLKEIPSTDPRFAQVIEELGGFRQVSKVIPLIQKFSEAEKALVVAQQGQGSLARDAAQAQGSLANQLAKVREEFDALLRKIAGNDAFKGLVLVTTQLATALIKVADAAVPLLPFLSIITALKVNKVAPAFFAGFAKKGGLGFNKGGEVPAMKFANGGLVPGSGNSDTVRANLTPGEFVMRKDAVKAIGANNLHGLQNRKKFQLGGRVEDIEDADIPEILRIMKLNPQPANVSTQDHFANIIKKLKNVIIDTAKDDRGAKLLGDHALGGINAIGIQSAISARKISLANKQDLSDKKAKKTKIANNITTLMPSEEQRTFGAIYLKPVGLSETTERRDVDMVSNIEGYGNIPVPIFYKHASMSTESSDNFTKRFDSVMPKVVSDLGRTLSSSFESKPKPVTLEKIPGYDSVKGWLFEGALASLGAPYDDTTDIDDKRTFDFPTGMGKLKGAFGTSLGANRPVDAKLTVGTQEASLNKKAKTWLYDNYKEYFKKPAKFAIGGKASGTDTVPALLTPGEFVFTKEAAQGIGYRNLHKMNKAKGYAKGGVVQGFATGGKVEGGGLFSGGGGILALAIGVQTLAQQFGSLSKEMQTAIGAVTSTGTNFIIFKGLLDQINPKWNGLSKSSQELQSSYNKVTNKLKSNDATLKKDAESNLQSKNVNLKDIVENALELKSARRLANRTNVDISAARTNPEQYIEKLEKSKNPADKSRLIAAKQYISVKQQQAKLLQNTIDLDDKSIAIADNRVKIAKQLQGIEKTAKPNIQKAQRTERNANIALGVAGAAGTIGGIASEYGASNIRAGGTSTFASGAGGFLQGGATGAMMGAAIGSIIPGIGTALGAAVGGIGGAIAGTVTSIQEANRQIAAVKFEATFKEFNRKLAEGASVEDLNKFGKQATRRISSTSGDDYVTALGQLESSSIGMDTEFKKLISSLAKSGAKSEAVLKKFYQTIDADTIGVFAKATGRTLTELNRDLKKVADSAVAIAAANKKVIQAVETVADRMNFFANVMNGVDLGDRRLNESNARSEFITSGQFKQSPSILQAFLDKPDSMYGTDISKIPQDAISLGGESTAFNPQNTIGSSLIDKVNESNVLRQSVRGVLGGIKGKGSIGNAQETAKEQFQSKTTDPVMLATITSTLAKYASSTDDPSKFANALEQDFEGVVKTLEEDIKKAGGFEELKKAIELDIKAFNEHLNIMSKVNELQKQNTGFDLKKIDINESYREDRKKFGLPVQAGANIDSEKQRVIFKNNALINDPQAAGAEAIFALNKLAKETQEIHPDFAVVDKFTQQLNNATSGLEYMSDYSSRASDVMKTISEIRAKKNEANAVVEGSASVSGRRELYKNLKLLEMATSGQVDNIKPEDQVGLLKFLESAPEAAKATFEQQNGNVEDFKQNLRVKLFANRPELSEFGAGSTSGIMRDELTKNLAATDVKQLDQLKDIAKTSKEAADQLQLLNVAKEKELQDEHKKVEIAKADAGVKAAGDVLKQETDKKIAIETNQESVQNQQDRLAKLKTLTGATNDKEVQAILQQSKDGFQGYKSKTQIEQEQLAVQNGLNKYGRSYTTENSAVFEARASLGVGGAGQRTLGLNSTKNADEFYATPFEDTKKRQVEIATEAFGADAAKLIQDDLGGFADLGDIGYDKSNVDLPAYRNAVRAKAEKLLTTRQTKLREQKDASSLSMDQAYQNRDAVKQIYRGRPGEGALPEDISDDKLQTQAKDLDKQQADASRSVEDAQEKFNKATENLTKVTDALNNFPRDISAQVAGTVNVNLNGATVLAGIEPRLQQIIQDQIQGAFSRYKEINGGRPNIPEPITPPSPFPASIMGGTQNA